MQISPITGHLIDNCLFPGLFAPWIDIDHSDSDRRHDSWEDVRRLNERREIILRHSRGHEVVMVQIATKTARQLMCSVAEGKHLAVADPIGMARLAGVTDIYVPAASVSDLIIGQHVVDHDFSGEIIRFRQGHFYLTVKARLAIGYSCHRFLSNFASKFHYLIGKI